MTKVELIKEVKRLKREMACDRKMRADSVKITNQYLDDLRAYEKARI